MWGHLQAATQFYKRLNKELCFAENVVFQKHSAPYQLYFQYWLIKRKSTIHILKPFSSLTKKQKKLDVQLLIARV